jgi:hypothetical protein
MALSKLDLAVVAVLAVGMLWIEHQHSIIVTTPAAAEAAFSAVCPETNDVPFSADCIAFIDGGVLPDVSSHLNTHPSTASLGAQQRAEFHASARPPSNENAPYSADCLKFISG